MRTLEYLLDPFNRDMVVTAFAGGLGVVIMCSVLSVLVVVKRLGFVGQGVSHSAFGGIGVASLVSALGLAGAASDSGLLQLAIVVLFCVGAALGMGAVGTRRAVPMDTAIGLFLVASMALGAVLVQHSRAIASAAGRASSVQSWESILFGSVLMSTKADAVVAWVMSVLVVLTLWWYRRPLLFWALDEETSRAFGVPNRIVKLVLMVLLSLAIVVAMKLAGVVLATALLVLPGATALKLSSRLWPVIGLSVIFGTLGLALGLVVSIELDWQTGPCVVLVMTALFALAAGAGSLLRRTDTSSTLPPATAPGVDAA